MPDCETLPPQAPGEYLGEDESFEGFSKTEQLVAGIWCDLLKLDRIGLHDNFFASGGHSLLAMQLVNQFDVHFGLDVSLRTVFECPTVTGLSAYIDDLLLQEIEPSPVLGDEE